MLTVKGPTDTTVRTNVSLLTTSICQEQNNNNKNNNKKFNRLCQFRLKSLIRKKERKLGAKKAV